MPTAYTSVLRLAQPATGELSGTWGDTVNNNITAMVEQAITGKATVAMADTDQTLTTANGTTDQARCMMVECTGALTATRNVICPTATKLYIVNNLTTGSHSVVFKTSGGTGVTVPPAGVYTVYCDGTNVVFVAGGGGGGLSATAIKTGAYNAVVNDLVRLDSTGGAFTVTLPASPSDGDKIGFLDTANKCGTYAVLIGANTKTVEGDGTGLSLNVNGAYVVLLYNSTGTNWKIEQTPPGYAGNVTGPGPSSVDSEIAIYNGTGGLTIKRASNTGMLKATSGVLATATPGVDYLVTAPVATGATIYLATIAGAF